MSVNESRPGISGMSVYVPRLRVPLEAWCDWTQNPWQKVQSVVGTGFRCCGPREDVYTMAASAVLRLIRQNDVDPQSIGYLAFGTETSTDNSAGAVIVKGMVDRALDQLGLPRLSRNCEVPEMKHACLAGVYALKNAARYLAYDGGGRKAIVVCADVAEYERGSSGEQTQGAGSVAMLVEPKARLLELDLAHAGSASDFRGPDFRKPHRRYFVEGYAKDTQKLHDFPVFSGKYSTFCYVDETLAAIEDLTRRLGSGGVSGLFERFDSFFFHRPYAHMPVQAMATIHLCALIEAADSHPELAAICAEASVTPEQLRAEVANKQDLFAGVLAGNAETDPYPALTRAAGALRRTKVFQQLLETKMSLGAAGAKELGNLYTASLPAWLASGLEQAVTEGRDVSGKPWLAVGYGSGDAAEAIPVRVAEGYRAAAERIGFKQALTGAVDLSREQYEALHDGRDAGELSDEPTSGFRIARIGNTQTPTFQDLGVEYYEYLG